MLKYKFGNGDFKIKITREISRENLQRAQEIMKEKHDQSAHDSTFNIMQYVLLKQEHIAIIMSPTYYVIQGRIQGGAHPARAPSP
jgi:hypothetical protein